MNLRERNKKEESFLDDLKVAIAQVVIRSKPQTMSSADYARIIQQEIQKTDHTWKQKAVKLQEQIYDLKHESLYLRLKYHSEQRNEDDCAVEDYEMELTEQNPKTLASDVMGEKMSFFKLVAALKLQRKSFDIPKDIDKHKFLGTFYIDAIKALTHSFEKEELSESLFARLKEITLAGREMFEAGLLENSEILVQHASQLAEGIIRCISKDQNSNSSKKDKLVKLLTSFAASNKLSKTLLFKLMCLVKGHLEVMQTQIHDDILTACYNVENLCYIFAVLENILVNWNEDSAALLEVGDGFSKIMENGFGTLIDKSPLVVHYIWKLTALSELKARK
eukprot:Seg1913.1 transcript_id=Seg1913.1/GoldUCD/mRNA.D3Y31 product="hypothetical protein" protein_id=Seg1913.1/GoldUCD/D3Y31